jgi:hypothetical protein
MVPTWDELSTWVRAQDWTTAVEATAGRLQGLNETDRAKAGKDWRRQSGKETPEEWLDRQGKWVQKKIRDAGAAASSVASAVETGIYVWLLWEAYKLYRKT